VNSSTDFAFVGTVCYSKDNLKIKKLMKNTRWNQCISLYFNL